MKIGLTPLVSLLFSGATITEHDDLMPGEARVGCPVWGRPQLLANLEQHLGLPTPAQARVVRVQRWSRRMAELEATKPGRFYARSYGLDPIGTATTLLGWHDELMTAGWNGDPIPNAGRRLETLRELTIDADLPPGIAERLRRVEDDLRDSHTRVYDELQLAEARTLWPGRWQRIFALFEELGTSVTTREASFEPVLGDSDLARLQAVLRGDVIGTDSFRGDGSIVVLCAETSWELAEGVSSLLHTWREPSTAVVRVGEERPLDYTLAAYGLASQGLDATSLWRPALQLLPLAVELAFEPRDPYRMLELLTLPLGPFQGLTGEKLAGALAKAPGIGGPAWREAKEEIASVTRASIIREAVSSGLAEEEAVRAADERVKVRLARIATWLEEPGHPVSQAAPRDALLAVADRVRTWLKTRLVTARKDADGNPTSTALAARADVLATAFAQAQAFHETLSHESRTDLDLVDVRLLVEQVSSGHVLELARERSGRIDHVGSPPRAWGRPRREREAHGPRRFTPTCVGTTAQRAAPPSRPTVHPHVRGDPSVPTCVRRSPPPRLLYEPSRARLA
jgi:ATP-dependent helicase/nuclease subunit B